jgi:hypothetical protein
MESNELLVPVREALSKVVAGKVHQETLRRWIRFGIRGTRLNCQRIANRYYCTPGEIRRFIAETNAKAVG